MCTILDIDDYQLRLAVSRMKAHVEFMTKIEENPYYPVAIEDYPKLFDFEMTEKGFIYFQRLKKEWSTNELSDKECLYLGMLHLAYATAMKSIKECKNWQAYMFLIGEKIDLENSDTKIILKQMGCIIDNPEYNPKLYKSHLLWKNKIFAVIDNM